MQTKTRYRLIDCLRALAVIAMIAYHALWDVVFIYEVNVPWYETNARHIIQLSIRWSFLLLSGFCFSMGRRPLKRGLVVLGCSVIVTLVSLVAVPETPIFFGVLTFLGAAMLLTIPAHKLLKKCNAYLGIAICVALFLATEDLQIRKVLGYDMPQWLYANDLTAFLGMPAESFDSSDYVPLIPWIFAYWIGYFLYRIFENNHWLDALGKVGCKPLEFIGRHSLVIYMAHQPVVYGLLAVIFYFIS